MFYFFLIIILFNGDIMKNSNAFFMFLTRVFISVILTLILLILIKSSSKFKDSFYKKVYESNISFSYFNELYKKYISSIDKKVEPVLKEKEIILSESKYLDGVKLEVDSNYLVKANKSGVVVFIGNKEGYNNTVIIQRIDGVDEWYGNISDINVSLYDYVSENKVIGTACNYLYLVYKKDGNILNYEEYIK